MTNEQLCALALAAIDDADSRVVLADALIEADWWDDRVSSPALGGWSRRITLAVLSEWSIGGYSDRCRAIAAVLLFGDWPTRWELAEKCRVETEQDRWWFDMQSVRRSDDEPALAVAQFPRDAVGDD